MREPEVLIVGAGVAGPSLAYWLARHGHRPTVVEQARELRSGGSAVVVKGPAIPVLEQMGVLPRLRDLATGTRSLRLLGPDGRPVLRIPLTSERAPTVEVTRSDLSTVLHQAAESETDFVFDDTVTALHQDDDGVDVTFRRSAPRRFDLVVGADGIHSAVRRLAFGDEAEFARTHGLLGGTVPLPPDAVDDVSEMTMLTAPGRMLVLHPSRSTPQAAFTFRAPAIDYADRRDADLHRRIVAEAYEGVGWRAPELVSAFVEHPAPFLDTLATIRLSSWSRGRVALLGDAAAATALFGDGSSMAVAGARALAAALADHPGDHVRAFAAYEAALRREVDPRQRRVNAVASLLVPRTRAGLSARNAAGRLLGRTVLRGSGAAASGRASCV